MGKHQHRQHPSPPPTPQADGQPAPDEIINMAREQGLPETEIEGVFRVNADDLCRVAAAILASRATADSVLEDAARLDWLGEDDGSHVIKVGKTWYTRPAFGHPHRKHKNLRAAIDAARAAQEGK